MRKASSLKTSMSTKRSVANLRLIVRQIKVEFESYPHHVIEPQSAGGVYGAGLAGGRLELAEHDLDAISLSVYAVSASAGLPDNWYGHPSKWTVVSRAAQGPVMWSVGDQPRAARDRVQHVSNIGDAVRQAVGKRRGEQSGESIGDAVQLLFDDSVGLPVAATVCRTVAAGGKLPAELLVRLRVFAQRRVNLINERWQGVAGEVVFPQSHGEQV